MAINIPKKNYFQYELPNEAMIYMFKYVEHPINLIVSCKRWSFISNDSQARADWIIFQFGRAHCLFHSIRLGPKFISVAVAQAIITKGGMLSRYFAQKLLIHFGEYDQKLIELKVSNGMGQTDVEWIKIWQKTIPWASNLPLSVYMFLLTEASNLYKADLCIKGNDMELFHFLSGGPNTINYASTVLTKNFEKIKDLILRLKFMPFPPRKSDGTQIDTQINSQEEYSPKNGYESSRQLNIIARSILIHKDLIYLWKEIGYFEICEDFNELVMQGALLTLFPPAQSPGWTKPDVNAVKERLAELIDLGFQLNYSIIIDIFHLFEHRLDDIGKILIDSFTEIKHEEKVFFLRRCLIETLKPSINMKNSNVSNLLYKYLPDNPEIEFKKAFYSYQKVLNI